MPVIPLGACMVAEAAEQAGHKVRLLDLMFADDTLTAIRREVESFQPDVVGLSVRNIDNNDLQSPRFFVRDLVPMIRILRRTTSATLVLGGSAVSVMPEELLRKTDVSWACLGDGEEIFPAFLEKLSKGQSPRDLPGVASVTKGSFEYNAPQASDGERSFRPPDFARWINMKTYLSRFCTVPFQSKVGCQFRCIYCTYRKIEGDRYRLSDPVEVADAVSGLSRRGLKDIEFVDNVFNSPYEHAMNICERLAAVNHGASLQSLELNPRFIDDDLIEAMEKAGFSGIGITVESASDIVLGGLRKGFDTSHVYRSAEVIKRHSLPCIWIFMLGGPGETRETVKETLRFAKECIRPTDVAFFGIGIRIYPRTELEEIARREGLLSFLPSEMLKPVFYVSPAAGYFWIIREVQNLMNERMNVMGSDSLGFRFLPAIHRISHVLGVRPPLWRHTRFIRRGLRMFGLDT
jgi:radical SAM superfamily enzyme YgiQ (UPF0313 family)